MSPAAEAGPAAAPHQSVGYLKVSLPLRRPDLGPIDHRPDLVSAASEDPWLGVSGRPKLILGGDLAAKRVSDRRFSHEALCPARWASSGAPAWWSAWRSGSSSSAQTKPRAGARVSHESETMRLPACEPRAQHNAGDLEASGVRLPLPAPLSAA